MVPGREKLNVPSKLTIALGAFVGGLCAIGLLMSLYRPSLELLVQVHQLMGGSPDGKYGLSEVEVLRLAMGWLVFGGTLTALGGWYLRFGRSMPLAILTCVGMATPCCTSSCYVVGLPLGITIFVLLLNQQVRDTFD